MIKILTKNLKFLGHLSTFRPANTPKSEPFKSQNNAQTILKQVKSNFEKVHKMTFFDPQDGHK